MSRTCDEWKTANFFAAGTWTYIFIFSSEFGFSSLRHTYMHTRAPYLRAWYYLVRGHFFPSFSPSSFKIDKQSLEHGQHQFDELVVARQNTGGGRGADFSNNNCVDPFFFSKGPSFTHTIERQAIFKLNIWLDTTQKARIEMRLCSRSQGRSNRQRKSGYFVISCFLIRHLLQSVMKKGLRLRWNGLDRSRWVKVSHRKSSKVEGRFPAAKKHWNHFFPRFSNEEQLLISSSSCRSKLPRWSSIFSTWSTLLLPIEKEKRNCKKKISSILGNEER